MSKPNNESYPVAGSIINFVAATACARKIEQCTKKINFSSSHRGQIAKLEKGYLIIDQEWYVKGKQQHQ